MCLVEVIELSDPKDAYNNKKEFFLKGQINGKATVGRM